MLQPLTRTWDRPFTKHLQSELITLLPMPKAAPGPVFRTLREIGAQGISFDIPTDRQEVLVTLHGE